MYSIAVSNLPPTTTEEDLIDHFSILLDRPDAVTNVSLAYNNESEIQLCFERGEIIKKKVKLVHEYRHTCTKYRLSTPSGASSPSVGNVTSGKNYDSYLAKEKEKMLKKMKDYNIELARIEKILEMLSNKESSQQVIVAFITFDKGNSA
jgi:hypothetical protein